MKIIRKKFELEEISVLTNNHRWHTHVLAFIYKGIIYRDAYSCKRRIKDESVKALIRRKFWLSPEKWKGVDLDVIVMAEQLFTYREDEPWLKPGEVALIEKRPHWSSVWLPASFMVPEMTMEDFNNRRVDDKLVKRIRKIE